MLLFERRGENRSSGIKTSRSIVENQQTQPTCDIESGNRTRATLVEVERNLSRFLAKKLSGFKMTESRQLVGQIRTKSVRAFSRK